MDNISSGDILISQAYLEDDYFFRSVICMFDHNDEGSFGLILNKKMPYTIGDALPLLHNLSNALYMGGPVDTTRLFFIHPYAQLHEAVPIAKDLYWNGDIEELQYMIELKMADPNKIRFYLGYAGWGPGQLASEVEENSWYIGTYQPTIICHQDEDDIVWRKAIETLGSDYLHIAKSPLDPSSN